MGCCGSNSQRLKKSEQVRKKKEEEVQKKIEEEVQKKIKELEVEKNIQQQGQPGEQKQQYNQDISIEQVQKQFSDLMMLLTEMDGLLGPLLQQQQQENENMIYD